jgi:hypothetical protein
VIAKARFALDRLYAAADADEAIKIAIKAFEITDQLRLSEVSRFRHASNARITADTPSPSIVPRRLELFAANPFL